jgi:ELWxxDGT repeat protein
MLDESSVSLTVSGQDLLLGGQTVGSIQAQTLQFILPSGGADVLIDLTRTDYQYKEVISLRGIATTITAGLSLRPNGDPLALPMSLTGTEEAPLTGQLHAATLPHATIAYATAAQPASGALQLDAAQGTFTYTGNMDFNGHDSFTFGVSEAGGATSTAVVGIDLAPDEDPPVATPQSVTAVEEAPTPITLNASDPDGDAVTFTIVSQPGHGTLTGAGPVVTYTSATDYNGLDSFTYYATDSHSLTSATVTVSITVSSDFDPPVATPQTLQTYSPNRLAITLAATDPDSPSLTYAVATQPSHGTLSGSPPKLVYQPGPAYVGDDSFTFTANDGMTTSAPATVTIHVLPSIFSATKLTQGFPISAQSEHVSASRVYFTAYTNAAQETDLWATDGTDTNTVKVTPGGTFGPFFDLGSTTYFTTGNATNGARIWQTTGGVATSLTDIPGLGAAYPTSATVGTPAIVSATAYLLLQWTSNASPAQYTCQIWSTDGTVPNTKLLYALPASASSCSGIWSYNGDQYFFQGASVMKFTGSTTAPAVVKSLGATVPQFAFVSGTTLFFQTSTPVGSNTSIDLWKTDGTNAGTVQVFNVDNSFIPYGVEAPATYNGKLYFAHGKDLLVSDGTTAGTSIIYTLPTNSWSSSAISYTSVFGANMYFLAWTDTTYGEPWVSNGTGAGTLLLKDIYPGAHGSDVGVGYGPYMLDFKSHIVFGADDGNLGPAVWTTDGTSVGTTMALDVPATVMLGIVGTTLVAYGAGYLYAIQ